MRVVVIGGGIGGLALAQGLVKRGVDVVVLDRDTDLAHTGGYKLHLGPRACDAARAVLPTSLWSTLRSRAVRTTGFEITVRDHRGRLLGRGTEEEGEALDVDRITLRLVLAGGLDHRLLTGVECVSCEETDDGVVVTATSGLQVEGDVAVIADGARSVFAPRLAGGPTATDTGLVGVAGRTEVTGLDAEARGLLHERPFLAVGPGGVGLFASWHAPRPVVPGAAGSADPVVIWGVISTAAQLPPRLHTLPGTDLGGAAHELLTRRGWAPALAGLPQLARTESIAGFQFLAADPRHIAPWIPGRVSAIGDATHAMPPTGGRGAGTAIRDAADLATRLGEAARGWTTIPEALQGNVAAMRGYAPQAVRESLEPIRWIKAGANPVGRSATRVGLPVLAGLAALRRRRGAAA